MRTRAAKLVLGGVGCLFAVLGIFWIRAATISTVERVPRPSWIEVIVDADARAGESVQTLPERVEALLLTCRIEVRSDLAVPVEHLGNGMFRAVFEPTMDRTDRRQFRGCVEDWLIDGVQADVESMTEWLEPPPGVEPGPTDP